MIGSSLLIALVYTGGWSSVNIRWFARHSLLELALISLLVIKLFPSWVNSDLAFVAVMLLLVAYMLFMRVTLLFELIPGRLFAVDRSLFLRKDAFCNPWQT